MVNGYYSVEPFTRRNFKNNSAFLVAASVCYQKLLVIQIVRDYRKYQYSGNWGKKVGLYF